MRAELIRAQQSMIERSFGGAAEFFARVLDDLRTAIDVPDALAIEPVEAVANLPFADLQELFAGALADAQMPESGIALSATNLARRAQLLRAFDDPDAVLQWATGKVIAIVDDLPKTAADIECGRNPGDVLDPYLLAATQSLLCEGDFRSAIGATVTHKALMILEGLMGHLHEEVIGRMRGNMKNPEPRAENAEILDFQFNPRCRRDSAAASGRRTASPSPSKEQDRDVEQQRRKAAGGANAEPANGVSRSRALLAFACRKHASRSPLDGRHASGRAGHDRHGRRRVLPYPHRERERSGIASPALSSGI